MNEIRSWPLYLTGQGHLHQSRFEDVDFKNLEIRVTESIWHQVVGVCKTEASAKRMPMNEYMAEDLRRWRRG